MISKILLSFLLLLLSVATVSAGEIDHIVRPDASKLSPTITNQIQPTPTVNFSTVQIQSSPSPRDMYVHTTSTPQVIPLVKSSMNPSPIVSPKPFIEIERVKPSSFVEKTFHVMLKLLHLW